MSDDGDAAVGAGVEQHGLDPAQLGKLAALLEVLASDEYAPTAVREPLLATQVHLADSLAALELGAVREATQLADLGSGAGFPGLALAVALPAAHVSLIESQRRSSEFLTRACTAARVENATVVWSRAEDWREGLSGNDVVLARALAAQPVVLEYAAPLLRLGGTLVDWRGRRTEAEEEAAERAAALLGLRRVEIRRVVPFEGARDHHLHVFAKVDETPPRFPRRAGIARKRPLGGRTQAS
jgi:16S rRNA (guanine527-N7)-methyltransferase